MEKAAKFLVSEFMHAEVPTVGPSATLRDVLATMVTHRTNGLVVINEAREILGIVSSWDIIQEVVPDYLETDKHLAAFEAGDIFAQRVTELQTKPVAEFMTKAVQVCHADHALMEAATLLSEHRIRQLPVVDQNKKLVGYINRTDIKLAMAQILGLE